VNMENGTSLSCSSDGDEEMARPRMAEGRGEMGFSRE